MNNAYYWSKWASHQQGVDKCSYTLSCVDMGMTNYQGSLWIMWIGPIQEGVTVSNQFPGSRPSTMDSLELSQDHPAAGIDGSRSHEQTTGDLHRGGGMAGGVVRGRAGSEAVKRTSLVSGRLSAATLERRGRERREAQMREWEAEMTGDLERQYLELVEEKRNKVEVCYIACRPGELTSSNLGLW